MNFFFVLFLGCIFFNSSVVAKEYSFELGASFLGVHCFPIISDKKASVQGGIMVSLKKLEIDNRYKPIDLKIPLLLFRYDDILNFTALPSKEEYSEGFSSNYSYTTLNWDDYFLKDVVDFEKNKFILNLYKGYNEIDNKRIYNGYLDAEKINRDSAVTLTVFETGMYCAYIAPPIDRGITEMIAPIKVYHSEFFSSNMLYANYSLAKYIIGLGILLAVYLINHISKFRRDREWNINNIPIISKAAIFYVLLPFLSFISLEWIVLFIEIHCRLNRSRILFFEYFRLTYQWIQPNWDILLRFYVLLFAMGYGVIYYNRGASRTFSKMPKRARYLAWSLFITNIIVTNIDHIYKNHNAYLKSYQFLTTHKETIEFICMICSTCCSTFPYVWDCASIYHYSKTKRIVKKLPPMATELEGIGINVRILTAFKQSLIIMAISPFVPLLSLITSGLRMFVLIVLSLDNLVPTDMKIGAERTSRQELIFLVNFENYRLQHIMKAAVISPEGWPRAIKIYVTIGLIYMIWIRTNNALVIENEKEDLKE